MIIFLKPDVDVDSSQVTQVIAYAERQPGVTAQIHVVKGTTRSLVEIYLLGSTAGVAEGSFEQFDCVERVVRVREKYRAIGRHGDLPGLGFEYNRVRMSQDTLHVFPGLCAVDTRENVERTFAALAAAGLTTARCGAYKPRTSPYDFQGLGAPCLPYVFELAGKHGIRIIAMEVTREAHVDEIRSALAQSGQATGVMLQIGTRNAQNFELLKALGHANDFPVLFKRGMGITLEESLNACEYIASAGNRRIVFCLRGVKSHLGDPHRNLVDFAHVPVVKRLTRLPVCVDPSHAVGRKELAPDGIPELFHAAAQGVLAGANMVLVDVHPEPVRALCDGPQALRLEELPSFLEDMALVRAAYEERVARVQGRNASARASQSAGEQRGDHAAA